MDRPVSLHIRTHRLPSLNRDALTTETVESHEDNDPEFLNMAKACSKSFMGEPLFIAKFADGRLVGFASNSQYSTRFHPPPREPESEPSLEDMRRADERAHKDVIENYLTRLDHEIISCNVASLYNRVLTTPEGSIIPEELRKTIANYVSLVHYKCELVPLRNPEIGSKICGFATLFEEARADDERAQIAAMTGSLPGAIIILSRNQKRVRDREYVLNCIATLCNLKFDTSGHQDSHHLQMFC